MPIQSQASSQGQRSVAMCAVAYYKFDAEVVIPSETIQAPSDKSPDNAAQLWAQNRPGQTLRNGPHQRNILADSRSRPRTGVLVLVELKDIQLPRVDEAGYWPAAEAERESGEDSSAEGEAGGGGTR